VILLLQAWRTVVIPVVAIPISLVGTSFLMAAFGSSLNNLSPFGRVLADVALVRCAELVPARFIIGIFGNSPTAGSRSPSSAL
jgi:multidrug efflux pump subunit AcrB